MRICFLDGHYPQKNGTGGGGAGWYIKTIGEQHIKNGHTVLVLKATPNVYKSDYIDQNGIKVVHYHTSSRLLTYLSKIKYLNLFTRPLTFLLNSWTAYKFLLYHDKKNKIDIIETVDGGNFWLRFQKYFAYVEHLHCSPYTIKKQCELPIHLGEKIERKLQLICIKNADAVISPSNAMLKIVEKEHRKQFQNKKSIPLCIKDFPKRKKIKSAKIKFIFGSRNDLLKGGDTLLKAIDLVNDSYYGETKFYFIGYEPDKVYSFHSNIIFRKFMPRNELLEFYNQCHVALLPTHFDNSPLFVYEAMAAALPVIATNIGGIPELIKHGETGYLFNKMDYLELSNYIIDLIQDDKKRKTMGNNAQNFIRKYASVEKIAEQKLNLYKNIIGVDCRTI